MSFIFYNRPVRFRLRYRRLLKKARIGKLVFKHLKRTFFSPNSKFNALRNKKHYAHSLLTTRLGRHTFLSNLSRFSFFLSPFLLSRCFLRKRGFFYKHYNKKRNTVLSAKKIRFKKNKPHNKFNKSGKRFISRRRKPFLQRGRFRRRRFSPRTKSISFYSFKALFRRTNILYFLFLLSFVRFFVGRRVSRRTESIKFKNFYSVNLPIKRSGIMTFSKNAAPTRLSRGALLNYQIKTLT